jgi:hypothetical protein
MRLLIVTALLAGAISVQAQQRTNAEKCAEYYDTRIMYLLGCCGDLPIADYPGPTFPEMGETERATRALQEIKDSRNLRCNRAGSIGARTLALNAISARLMRAQARSKSKSATDLQAAVLDAEMAVRDLQSFVDTYRASAVRIWYWIAMAFRHGGQTWKALAFVGGLPENCCRTGEKDVFLADLYFDLGVLDAANEYYSAWLKASGELCGHDRAVRNVEELRRRGFLIAPVPPSDPGVSCMSNGEWQPTYVTLPEH